MRIKDPTGVFEKADQLFSLILNSPDGNSGRTLVLNDSPGSFKGTKLYQWRKGEEPLLEAYLAERGIYPEW
jgi:hypothetical protein